jgi:hypothetical protein
VDKVSLDAIRDSAIRWWENSGSSATTPPEPTGEIPHTLTVVLQLAEFLHNQGWLRVDTLTWGKLSYSQGGKCPVQIQVTLPTSTTGWPTSGAKENPGGQPTLNTQESGGTGCPAQAPAKSNEADDAIQP